MKIRGDKSKIVLTKNKSSLEIFKSIDEKVYITMHDSKGENKIILTENDLGYKEFYDFININLNNVKVYDNENNQSFIEFKVINKVIEINSISNLPTLLGNLCVNVSKSFDNELYNQLSELIREVSLLKNSSFPGIFGILKDQGNIIYKQNYK